MIFERDDFARMYPEESEFVEWKEGFSQERVQQAAAAFSNADGGVILLGVADDGRLVGRRLTEGLLQDLHRAMGGLHDPGRYELRALVVGDVPLTAVSVARREHGFTQLPDGRPLVRRGKMNVALFGDDLRTFVSHRSLVQFDRTGAAVNLSDASSSRFGEVRRACAWSEHADRRQRLREQGLIVSADRPDPELTVAGAGFLLDSPEGVLGKTFVEVFRYSERGAEFDRRIEITGPFDAQVKRTTSIVTEEVGQDMVVLGTFRHELPRLPEVVVREAVANAVAHRDLELHGVAIRVDLFPDLVRITSPGRFPEPVTEANIRDAQSARNPTVLNLLRRFGLAEDAGRGVDVMQDVMRAELLEPPEIRELDRAVEVDLHTRGAVSPQERAWVREVERRGEISAQERVLLVHAARGEVLTNGVVRELLGVDSVDARQLLQHLRDLDYLDQDGTRGGTTYQLGGDLQPPAGLRLGTYELEALVLALAQSEGRITNAMVRARTGLDRVATTDILSRLARSGRLRRRGERRGTYYELPDDSVHRNLE
jgi:ATP-dependent DNA helicase RecG